MNPSVGWNQPQNWESIHKLANGAHNTLGALLAALAGAPNERDLQNLDPGSTAIASMHIESIRLQAVLTQQQTSVFTTSLIQYCDYLKRVATTPQTVFEPAKSDSSASPHSVEPPAPPPVSRVPEGFPSEVTEVPAPSSAPSASLSRPADRKPISDANDTLGYPTSSSSEVPRFPRQTEKEEVAFALPEKNADRTKKPRSTSKAIPESNNADKVKDKGKPLLAKVASLKENSTSVASSKSMDSRVKDLPSMTGEANSEVGKGILDLLERLEKIKNAENDENEPPAELEGKPEIKESAKPPIHGAKGKKPIPSGESKVINRKESFKSGSVIMKSDAQGTSVRLPSAFSKSIPPWEDGGGMDDDDDDDDEDDDEGYDFKLPGPDDKIPVPEPAQPHAHLTAANQTKSSSAASQLKERLEFYDDIPPLSTPSSSSTFSGNSTSESSSHQADLKPKLSSASFNASVFPSFATSASFRQGNMASSLSFNYGSNLPIVASEDQPAFGSIAALAMHAKQLGLYMPYSNAASTSSSSSSSQLNKTVSSRSMPFHSDTIPEESSRPLNSVLNHNDLSRNSKPAENYKMYGNVKQKEEEPTDSLDDYARFENGVEREMSLQDSDQEEMQEVRLQLWHDYRSGGSTPAASTYDSFTSPRGAHFANENKLEDPFDRQNPMNKNQILVSSKKGSLGSKKDEPGSRKDQPKAPFRV